MKKPGLSASDLKPNPANPRQISDKQLLALAKSLYKFGDLSGIVMNLETGNLVGGHQRLKAIGTYEIRGLDIDSTPDRQGTVGTGSIVYGAKLDCRMAMRVVKWDEPTEKAAMIAANKHGGAWDNPKLTDLLIELDDGSFDMELTGFTEEERETLAGHAPPEEEKPKESVTHKCPECGHEWTR